MVTNKCSLCHHLEFDIIYIVQNYKIVCCKKCNHYYTLIEEEINEIELYSSGDYEKYDSQNTIFEKIIDFENKNILRKIEKIISKGKILDFGSGKGKFLKISNKFGWETLGIETSLPRAEFAEKNYKLNIIKQPYKQGKINDGLFDVISFFHVLEHISDPGNLIANIVKDNLKDNGLLVIEVPNFNSFQSQIAGKNWLHLDVPRHINHFTRLRLISLLNGMKFQVVKIEYLSYIHGLQGMLNSIFNVFGYRRNLISELKYRRKPSLLLIIIMAIPFAFIMESLASLFKRGAIIRIYAQKF